MLEQDGATEWRKKDSPLFWGPPKKYTSVTMSDTTAESLRLVLALKAIQEDDPATFVAAIDGATLTSPEPPPIYVDASFVVCHRQEPENQKTFLALVVDDKPAVREAVSALTSVDDVYFGPISPDGFVPCTPSDVVGFLIARETNWQWSIPNIKRALHAADEEKFKLEYGGPFGSGTFFHLEIGQRSGVEATTILMEGISVLDEDQRHVECDGATSPTQVAHMITMPPWHILEGNMDM